MKRISQINAITDLDSTSVMSIIDDADALEQHILTKGSVAPFLRGKCLAMVFDETSLRTRSAFERAMFDLGGHAIHFSGKEARVGRNAEKTEHLEDFVNVIGRFNDALLTRIYDHALQARIAAICPVPFINGMCDQHHPTQALCDFLTIRRRLHELKGLKVAFIGDGTNVATSLAQTAALVGARFVIATPANWAPPSALVDDLEGYTWTADPHEAAKDADVIIGDVWIPMNKAHEAEQRRTTLLPYSITCELMALARPHAFFMHNLPANRGDEVTPEVIDGPQSAIYEEAVARLHIARALLLHLLHSNPRACIESLKS
ncbi:ornithine carbamoyltransferase [Paraherbaspirillum soli]|uniref:Ornithine carbamoyltransferase n=1 Tax=Paraherbaspirillum soli TaxID=631222 RepID=A0ABW0ME11_9BURK